MKTIIGILITALALSVAAEAKADTWLNVHGFTWHLNTDGWTDNSGTVHAWEEVNYGLGITHEWQQNIDVRIGALRNSYGKGSVYAGGAWHTSYSKPVSAALQAGIITGYQGTPTGGDAKLLGYAMPTLGVNYKSLRAEIGYIPKFGSNKRTDNIITLSFAWRLR